MKHDLYLGEILKSRGHEVISDTGDYSNPATDTMVITFVIDYIREQKYLDVSKLTDQELYDMVQEYLEKGIPAYEFMEELEAKYGIRE